MQKHRKRNLANKACAADKENLFIFENFGW
jgi:hypothetical protein